MSAVAKIIYGEFLISYDEYSNVKTLMVFCGSCKSMWRFKVRFEKFRNRDQPILNGSISKMDLSGPRSS